MMDKDTEIYMLKVALFHTTERLLGIRSGYIDTRTADNGEDGYAAAIQLGLSVLRGYRQNEFIGLRDEEVF